MAKVWKFELMHQSLGSQVLTTDGPDFVRIAPVSFGTDLKDNLVVWAEVHDDAEQRWWATSIRLVLTGDEAPGGNWKFLGTAISDGAVWHAYWTWETGR